MMERISKNDINSFIRVFYSLCERFGIRRVAAKLSELNDEDKSSLDKLKDKIFSETAITFTTTPNEIITSNRQAVLPARVCCVLLFDKHLKLTNEQIGNMFNEHRSAVNKKIRQFEKINSNIELAPESGYSKIFTAEFIDTFKMLDEKITTYSTILKTIKILNHAKTERLTQ